ncbi:MAG: NGG1p interacting factor NIF3 [Candidatus Omnitrophica bacterium]|nr:NGG1p interacting factor NIF3 [Candidatus Omnitrophota bacterium]
MKLGEIYKTVTDFGMKMDPRPADKLKKELLRAKKEYDGLDSGQKKFYDKERLIHPYSDTRMLFGDKETEVKTMLVGVDMEVGEVLLADRLREKGEKIDLVFAHHPEGIALAGFFNVMYMQIDILNNLGVPINIAESLMSERISEVERRVLPANHMRAVDAARLLGIPFMTCHTPADNCVVTYLQDIMDKKKPETLGDIIDILMKVPEYAESAKQNCPPKITRGTSLSKAGKVFVDMTGGTEGHKNIFSKLSQAGVSTLVCMHLSEDHFKKAKEEHMNVIIAGHIASDNIGLNIMLDHLETRAKIKILPCSGFRRFSRKGRV